MNAKASLLLEMMLPEMPLYPTGDRLVTARLTNTGRSAIVINHRLAIGYRDHLAREMFAELRKPETGELMGVREVDYDRNFSPPSDYEPLQPGRSVETTFDFFEWYRPARGGTYWMVLYYQADEPLAKAPASIAAGTFSSRPETIQIELEGAAL